MSGAIDLAIPCRTDGRVIASSISGRIDSEFALIGTDTHRQGTLGSGGPTLTLNTLSGAILLRRSER